MLTEEHRRVLDSIGETTQGRVLRELVEEEMKKIDTIRGITSVEEIIGRQKSLEALERIFAFLQKKNPNVSARPKYE